MLCNFIVFQSSDNIPSSTKLKAFEVINRYDRCIEERRALRDDANNIANYYSSELVGLHEMLEKTMDVCKRSLIFKKIQNLEDHMCEFWTVAFQHYPDFPEMPQICSIKKLPEFYDTELVSDAEDSDSDVADVE